MKKQKVIAAMATFSEQTSLTAGRIRSSAVLYPCEWSAPGENAWDDCRSFDISSSV